VAGAQHALPAGPRPGPDGAAGGASLTRAVAQRFSWGLADQAMSSLSNAAVSLYMARELGAVDYGAFAEAYVTYAFVLNISRGLATDPLLVRFSHVGHPVWKRAVQGAAATAAVVGLVLGLGCLLFGTVTSGTTRASFVALGISLPGLMLQDSWRYSFFALGKGSKAFVNDTIWTVSLVAALLVLRETHHQTVFWFVLAWGATASLAALAGPLQARLLPRWDGPLEWLAQTRDLGTRYMFENAGLSSSNQLRLYAVGLVAGLAAVGYIQEGITLLGPFSVIFMGVSLVTVPEAARALRRSTRQLRLYCFFVGCVLTLGALLWGVVLLVAMPRGLGALLLGNGKWHAAYGIAGWMVLSMMGATMTAGASAGMRALGAARRSMRITLIGSAIYIVLGVSGAVLGGVHGSVAGTALATWIGAALSWWQLRVALREFSASLAGAAADRVPSGRNRTDERRSPTERRASCLQLVGLCRPVDRGRPWSDVRGLRADHFGQRLHRRHRRHLPPVRQRRLANPLLPAAEEHRALAQPQLLRRAVVG
jgi:O-antigen/teichoic acid export membrane protein